MRPLYSCLFGQFIFMAAKPSDQELQDKELADNEVQSAEISEYEVEKLTVNEEDVIDEARLPLINKG